MYWIWWFVYFWVSYVERYGVHVVGDGTRPECFRHGSRQGAYLSPTQEVGVTYLPVHNCTRRDLPNGATIPFVVIAHITGAGQLLVPQSLST